MKAINDVLGQKDKNTERQKKTIWNSEGFQANSNEQQNDKNTWDSEGFQTTSIPTH